MRRPWPNRRLSYFVDGKVRTISQGGSEAVYRYDAFGSVERLDIDSDTSPDTRRDHSYGDLLGWNGAASGGASAFLTRKIPGPDGLVATRRGANGPWVFEFGEARGGRFFVDETGSLSRTLTILLMETLRLRGLSQVATCTAMGNGTVATRLQPLGSPIWELGCTIQRWGAS